MSFSHNYLSIRRNSKKFDLLNNPPAIKKFRIVPEWQKDIQLEKTEPKQSRKQSFMVRRKQEIQKNRWKTVIKQLSTVQQQKNSNLDEFKRKASVKIVRNNESRFLRFVGLDQSKSLPNIDSSFKKGQMFTRLAQRTQPYWKKFLQCK